ncbi:MAG: relaxase/mobilization nuclease domain-containing protein [Desulfovibrionales bacterium]|nr:relaxase/mobilization nuclease domain-containing protein [Desulfovibrionales bacterium]
MISKRIFIKAAHDNYARLAAYISNPGPRGEKILFNWSAGCVGGDNYQENIAEVLDVQALNTRTQKSKTYHLVVSFRPEDERQLTPEIFQAIEEKMAQALGYQDHQRHCGVHKDTANIHMHVAYNMISIELSHSVRGCVKSTLFQEIINAIQVRQSTNGH